MSTDNLMFPFIFYLINTKLICSILIFQLVVESMVNRQTVDITDGIAGITSAKQYTKPLHQLFDFIVEYHDFISEPYHTSSSLALFERNAVNIEMMVFIQLCLF